MHPLYPLKPPLRIAVVCSIGLITFVGQSTIVVCVLDASTGVNVDRVRKLGLQVTPFRNMPPIDFAIEYASIEVLGSNDASK